MKKVIWLLSIILPGIIFNSCNPSEPEKLTDDYTYSIVKASWDNPVDNNGDGYATNRNLIFQVKLDENVKRDIIARIYYKPNGGSNYTFYGESIEYAIDGFTSPITIEYPVGSPKKELKRDIYDFMIEVYEQSSERLEASLQASDSLGTSLHNQKFESLSTDQIYNVNITWSDIFDNNKNGYAQTANLKIDVNVEKNISKDVFLTLFYKKSGETNYTAYKTESTFTIHYQDHGDAIDIGVGTKLNGELENGEYDFQVVVYEAKTQNIVAVLDPAESDSLSRRKFETRDEDSYYYTINYGTIQWTDKVDLNNNGYTSSRKILIDVDVDKNTERELYASVYYVNEDSIQGDSTQYNEYYTDKNTFYKIFGQSSIDPISLEIGALQDTTKYLFKGKYNFILNFYEKGDTNIVATVGNLSSALLSLQQFETFTQDTTSTK